MPDGRHVAYMDFDDRHVFSKQLHARGPLAVLVPLVLAGRPGNPRPGAAGSRRRTLSERLAPSLGKGIGVVRHRLRPK